MIGSGIQVLADEKPAEHWGQYPGARQRLFSLLRRRAMERFVFISGDVHIGEVQAVAPFDGQGAAALRNGVGPLRIPVIDVTASGLTHTVDFPFLHSVGLDNILPSRRVKARYVGKNFGTATLTARRLPHPRTGGGAASHRDVEVTASLCIHRVEDGAAVIRHDVDLFGKLSLPDSDSDGVVEIGGDEASGGRDGSSTSAQSLGKEGLPGPHPYVPHWLRSRSKAALQAEFRECPLSCDLSRVPPSPIRELVIFVQWALPVRATLPVVIKGLLLTGVTVFASLIVLCAYILCRRWVRALRGRVPKSKFE